MTASLYSAMGINELHTGSHRDLGLVYVVASKT